MQQIKLKQIIRLGKNWPNILNQFIFTCPPLSEEALLAVIEKTITNYT